jgi:hypothetical protein
MMPTNVKRGLTRLMLLASACCVVGIGAGCEGDGSDGAAPRIEFQPTLECIRFAGGFPSGFALLPGAENEAAVVQFAPTVVLGLELDTEPPTLLADSAIPEFPELPCNRCGGLVRVDSDADGEPDACRSDELGFTCLSPAAGSLHGIDRTLVALSTSSYEQVLFVDPRDGRPRIIEIDTPPLSGLFDPADWPFWPAVGSVVERSGLSTRVCVYGDDLEDSLGDPIGSNQFCDDTRNGFVTRFTAGSAIVGDHLFVTMSNLLRSSRTQFAPGTVLVFEFDKDVEPPRARPDPENPVILTSGFNPTSVTAYTTPSGRQLALVGVSGAIALGTGSDLVRTDSAIDVIDVLERELIATIPLGPAGLGFAGLSIDSTRRIALIGAATQRSLFGIDLAALDDPTLGMGLEPLPVVLDGGSPGFPDARLYDADAPLQLPKRPDGPSNAQCTTQTSVALSALSDFGVTSDFCDGTLAVLKTSTPTLRTTPLDPADVVSFDRLETVAAPLVDDSTGQLRAIDRVTIRPGVPGLDFAGPDVYFTAGLPEGAVCGVRIENP